jgi:hypothetical protein
MADTFNKSSVLAFAIALLSLTGCQHPATKVAAGPPPPVPGPKAAPSAPSKTSPPLVPASSAPANVEPVKPETHSEASPPTVPPAAPTPETKDVPPVTEKPSSRPLRTSPKPPAANPPVPDPKPKADLPTAPTTTSPVAPARIEATLPAAEQSAYRKRAEKAILATQQNLDALKDRRLSRDDQTTLRQAAMFLRDAQKAIKNGDLAGAATLAEKSRVLSEELRKRVVG